MLILLLLLGGGTLCQGHQWWGDFMLTSWFKKENEVCVRLGCNTFGQSMEKFVKLWRIYLSVYGRFAV